MNVVTMGKIHNSDEIRTIEINNNNHLLVNVEDDGAINTIKTNTNTTNTKLDTVNTNLATIETDIETTNTRLADTNTKLDTTNSKLTGIDGLLTTIDSDTGDIRTLTGTSANSLAALELDLVDRRINLQYQRSLGNCYMVSDETRLTANTNAFVSILNPSTSGKTMYVYSLSFSISDRAATNVGGVILLESFAQANYTIGTNANDGKNLLIGQPDSPMEGARNSTITSRTPLIREAFSFSTTTTQELFQFTRDMSKDMIEVPAGYGLCFSLQDDTSATLELDYSLNFRFCLL